MASQNVTLRVSISNPSAVNLQSIQHAFQGKGFEVEPDGRRGFLLTSNIEKIEETFGVSVKIEKNNFSFDGEPKEDSILKNIDFRAYFPTTPEFF